jgi:hypothetical protein
MTTIRLPLGELQLSHGRTGTALMFLPDQGKDTVIPGLSPSDLRLLGLALLAEADSQDQDQGQAAPVESVQVRIGGTPEAVTRAAQLLDTAHGLIPGPMTPRARHERLVQGYLTAVVQMEPR